MGSFNPPERYGSKTRIDLNQSYQVAYWNPSIQVNARPGPRALRGGAALILMTGWIGAGGCEKPPTGSKKPGPKAGAGGTGPRTCRQGCFCVDEES